MLTHALYLTVSWLIISLVTAILFGKRLRQDSALLSYGWLFLVLGVGDVWLILTYDARLVAASFTGLALIVGVISIQTLRDWHAFGQVAWISSVMAIVTFIFYTFAVTIFASTSPFAFLAAFVFSTIEALALLVILSHTFENLDVACRLRSPQRIDRITPIPDYTPKVSLHVPAYDEPPEIVEATLRALSELDYPNFEVLVIDNNTPSEQTWQPIAALCRALGPRFRFLHLDRWPGYKSGALNFALTQTALDAEIIGVIDADYQVDPDFLRETVAAFYDSQVAFLQTPQDYRDYAGSPYFEALYYSYKYFFEVPMPVRNEHNAIIFGGTMGLIRKSVLQEIGGWDEWCITEDAEASLRILKRGYRGLYYNRTFGRGLMPLSFEGLKKQRFRWSFGGVQILRKHWEALMPWASLIDEKNRLTLTQQYFYLIGGLQWFTDLFNIFFAMILVILGLLSAVDIQVAIRPLTGPIIIVPIIFLGLNLMRFLWILRQTLNLSWSTALRAMYGMFSISWTIAYACVQGLIHRDGIFLRTPKIKEAAPTLNAVRVTSWETGLGLLCLMVALVVFDPDFNSWTGLLTALLGWHASLYLAAPIYSLMGMRATATRSTVAE